MTPAATARRRRARATALVVTGAAGGALVLAACSGHGGRASQAGTTPATTATGSDSPSPTGTPTIGPAPTGAATGRVVVTESDDAVDGLDGIAPRPGDTVTFDVTNAGTRTHDFAVTGPDGARLAATPRIPPHGTAHVTLTFADTGTYTFGSDLAGDTALSGSFAVTP